MRLLTTGITVLAVTAFAAAPAMACSWGKTAKAKKDMTVAEVPIVPEETGDISIATNDLSDEALKELELLVEPSEELSE